MKLEELSNVPECLVHHLSHPPVIAKYALSSFSALKMQITIGNCPKVQFRNVQKVLRKLSKILLDLNSCKVIFSFKSWFHVYAKKRTFDASKIVTLCIFSMKMICPLIPLQLLDVVSILADNGINHCSFKISQIFSC